jgi:acetylornithine deacetylase/succinyl-diaminopimelate desuccinylase-like protein
MIDATPVAHRADAAFDAAVARLSAYLRIPAISCDPAHGPDVRRLAAKVRDDLEALGLERARVLDLPDALPVVAAEWTKAGPDAPTVLVYGHLDLQPVKGERWDTAPHDATEREGRLYARGSADDMGGWVSHIAALEAWFAEGGPPCNLRLVIEGEEEIGSPNLERFMDAYPDAFVADVMILTDCENPSTEIPGLTVSLRGLLEIELTVSALSADGHSGLWGNMVPDTSVAVCKLVARLTDDDGRLRVGRVEVPEDWRRGARDVPLTEATFREGAHVLPGVPPLPERGVAPAEWMWRQPAMTVVATSLPKWDVEKAAADGKKNALRARTVAVLSCRVAPGQTPQELYDAVTAELHRDPPFGVQVSTRMVGTPGQSWLYTPKGPAFAAADRAYTRAWGRPMVQIGVGGTIPFVALFGQRFGDLPLILNGVMDPRTTAHGPNESLDLGVFRKAIAANVWLYQELGALGRDGLR